MSLNYASHYLLRWICSPSSENIYYNHQKHLKTLKTLTFEQIRMIKSEIAQLAVINLSKRIFFLIGLLIVYKPRQRELFFHYFVVINRICNESCVCLSSMSNSNRIELKKKHTKHCRILNSSNRIQVESNNRFWEIECSISFFSRRRSIFVWMVEEEDIQNLSRGRI